MGRQRIRDSAAYAAAQAGGAANAVEAFFQQALEVLADFEERGIVIEIPSILGLNIPETCVRLRLGESQESEESDEE